MTIMIYVYLCMYFHGINFFERHIFRSHMMATSDLHFLCTRSVPCCRTLGPSQQVHLPSFLVGGQPPLKKKEQVSGEKFIPKLNKNQYMFSWQLNKYTMRSYIWNCQLCLYREVLCSSHACERAGRSIQVMMSWTLVYRMVLS